MCVCARLAIARSPSAKPRFSRNSLKPCFVDTRSGTPVNAPVELAVDVGVHEVCVQDPRPSCARGSRRAAGRRPGRRPRRAGIASSGMPRARSSRAKSHAPGSCSCSIRKRTSQPRSFSRGSSESRCASEPEMPATFCRWRTVHVTDAAARIPSAHVSTEWLPATRSRSVRPISARSAAPSAREPAQTVGEALGRVAVEGERIAVEQLVEDRIRREHRQARGRRLVDDLVGRAGLACC